MQKTRRIEIFDSLEDGIRFEFMVSDKFLLPKQKVILWDNIGKDNRIKMWKSASDRKVIRHCQKLKIIAEDPSLIIEEEKREKKEKEISPMDKVKNRKKLANKNKKAMSPEDLLKNVMSTTSKIAANVVQEFEKNVYEL